jgi:hypothetical protein
MNSTGCATQSSRSAAGPRISSRGSAEIEGQIEGQIGGRDIAPPHVFLTVNRLTTLDFLVMSESEELGCDLGPRLPLMPPRPGRLDRGGS